MRRNLLAIALLAMVMAGCTTVHHRERRGGWDDIVDNRRHEVQRPVASVERTYSTTVVDGNLYGRTYDIGAPIYIERERPIYIERERPTYLEYRPEPKFYSHRPYYTRNYSGYQTPPTVYRHERYSRDYHRPYLDSGRSNSYGYRYP